MHVLVPQHKVTRENEATRLSHASKSKHTQPLRMRCRFSFFLLRRDLLSSPDMVFCISFFSSLNICTLTNRNRCHDERPSMLTDSTWRTSKAVSDPCGLRWIGKTGA